MGNFILRTQCSNIALHITPDKDITVIFPTISTEIDNDKDSWKSSPSSKWGRVLILIKENLPNQ